MYKEHWAPAEPDVRKAQYKIPFSIDAYRNRRRSKEATFSDLRVIQLNSGAGGDGKASFLREAGRAKGPPDGGDGGRGGSIYVQAVEGETSLHKLRQFYRAEDGRAGGSDQLAGRNGTNMLIQVPVGTLIKWVPSMQEIKDLTQKAKAEQPESSNTKQLPPDIFIEVEVYTDFYTANAERFIQLERPSYPDGQGWIFKEKEDEHYLGKEYFQKLNTKVRFFDLITRRKELDEDRIPYEGIDLDKAGDPILLLRGGSGGMGNMHFQTPDIRNPRFAKKARSGLSGYFLFELKLLADLGLVGLPNAGKSTLLRAISRARPRVGHWEFTTLNPTVGSISLGISGESFTVADIPGIIRGASENRGMGLDFLRHVERSGGLAFVIALDTPDPAADLQVLLDEMGPQRMEKKNVVVIATKADVKDSQSKYAMLQAAVSQHAAADPTQGWQMVPCCAQQSENVEAVIAVMAEAAKRKRVDVVEASKLVSGVTECVTEGVTV